MIDTPNRPKKATLTPQGQSKRGTRRTDVKGGKNNLLLMDKTSWGSRSCALKGGGVTVGAREE